MREGFLIGGGLIVAGLMLELSVGPVAWDAFRWPLGGIVLACFIALIAIVFMLRKRVYAFQFIGTYKAAIPTLIYAVVLTTIMGLTRQTVDGVWLNNMLSFWPFVLIYVYLALILGLTVLRQLSVICSSFLPSTTKSPPPNGRSWKRVFPYSLLSHLGLFIALTTATLGNADMQRLKMITMKGQPEWRALTPQQQVVEMPIAIELNEFIMETYDDGSPKRFASDIQIMTKKGQNLRATVEVNKPVEVNGWRIYQFGYDTQMGAKSQISILELVRDPWLPFVYTGIYMMLAGAVCMFFFGGRKKQANRKL